MTDVRIGVVFPQTELGGDVGAVRAYGERVDELGFAHILAYDHVLGADPAVHTNWSGPYDSATTFHEPFVASSTCGSAGMCWYTSAARWR